MTCIFANLRINKQRSIPENYLLYKHALALYKLYWSKNLSAEFIALNFNSILTTRQVNFIATKSNKRKVGLKALANHFYTLNNRTHLLQLNKSPESYKVFCKKEFLKCS